jgi:hypothetical protein
VLHLRQQIFRIRQQSATGEGLRRMLRRLQRAVRHPGEDPGSHAAEGGGKMKMTDEKLLAIYQDACQDGADNKQIVIKLAETNECSVWEMATHLKEIGADIKLNQFSKFNPKRGGGKEDGGRIEYLKTIIKRQDEEIRRQAAEINELRAAPEAAPERDEETELLLNEYRDRIAHLEQELVNQPETRYINMSDIINRFCGDLCGVSAYLTGRIIETLYRWRFAGESDQLLMTPGLIDELTNLIFDKTEGTT